MANGTCVHFCQFKTCSRLQCMLLIATLFSVFFFLFVQFAEVVRRKCKLASTRKKGSRKCFNLAMLRHRCFAIRYFLFSTFFFSAVHSFIVFILVFLLCKCPPYVPIFLPLSICRTLILSHTWPGGVYAVHNAMAQNLFAVISICLVYVVSRTMKKFIHHFDENTTKTKKRKIRRN